MSNLELRQLRHLLAVAESSQITQAARRLNIAQSTLSQSLGQLEAHLGVRLLERRPRGVSLTDTGEMFVERARVIVQSADQAVDEARAFARTRRP